MGTILLGISSFMYQTDSHSLASIGALTTTDADKKKYAAESIAFNQKNKVFVELFGGEGTAAEMFGVAEYVCDMYMWYTQTCSNPLIRSFIYAFVHS